MNCNLIVTACSVLLILLPGAAPAQMKTDQSFKRPTGIIVPGSAGSTNGITAHVIAQRFTGTWWQQIVVDNRSSAGSLIAHNIAARANSDGYGHMQGIRSLGACHQFCQHPG